VTPLYPNLFSPVRLGDLTLQNRIVMAPMSTQLANADGSVSPQQLAFYTERARGGTGLIVVEFCSVHAATGRSEHRQLVLESEAQLEGHIELVSAIRKAGAAACLQLQHGGPGVKRSLVEGGVAVGPSDVLSRRDPGRRTARALTHGEIEHLIECFGRTAELAMRAGYQGIELHGAHGYLLTTFLSPLFNHRNDEWGGDEDRRLRFPTRVIARVKEVIGARPLIYRFSAEEFSPQGLGIQDFERIAPLLVAAGADALHVSIGLGATSFDKVIEPISMPEGWRLPYARRIRQATGVPVITVGQIRWPETAERALRDGDADLIALGRTLLADPEWANKARRGAVADIRPCTSCNFCITLGMGEHGTIGCAENPRAGRELDPLPDAAGKRGTRAVVVGGGPGGMAAALLLDQAGYATELYESRPALGGGLIASAAPPFKDKLRWYQTYLEHRLSQSGVRVSLARAVDLGTLRNPTAAVLILAIGGRPVRLDIEGIDCDIVHDAYEVLMGDRSRLPPQDSRPALVYGGGETGCEAAEYLAELGYRVILVSRSQVSQLARSAEMIYRGVLLERIVANPRIRVIAETHLIRITDSTATLQRNDGTVETVPVGSVLVAQGRSPDSVLELQLREAGVPYVAIGDARRGGRIGDAVRDAYEAVMSGNSRPQRAAHDTMDLRC
jgi:2,4-dienoyl-CoA reductase (NADPH2)